MLEAWFREEDDRNLLHFAIGCVIMNLVSYRFRMYTSVWKLIILRVQGQRARHGFSGDEQLLKPEVEPYAHHSVP